MNRQKTGDMFLEHHVLLQAPLKPWQHGALQILYCIALHCIVLREETRFKKPAKNISTLRRVA